MSSLHDFRVKNAKNEWVEMRTLTGKVTLIVNVASHCGFTPQYEGLEQLHVEFKRQGLAVIGFPCNQFGAQEPGSNEEIQQFCQLNYGVTFPIMGKVDVNGENADPLFQWLKKQAPGFLGTEVIKWNFTKFLLDKNGQVVRRFAPKDKPEMLRTPIRSLLT